MCVEKLGLIIRPVPPVHHSNNSIEKKRRIIRIIELSLKEAAEDSHDALLDS